MHVEDGQHLLFVGDSITDCGRRGENAPYGDGYVNLLRTLTTARHSELRLTWTNRGVSGDTVRNLADRWDADVLAHRPDWLSVMIGINDVWRSFDGNPQYAVPLDEFTDTLRHLLRRAVDETGCRLILADPYLIEPDPAEPQRATSDAYACAVAALAEEFAAVHVATQQAFDRVLSTTDSRDWAKDRIHPNLAGHAVITEAFRAALGI